MKYLDPKADLTFKKIFGNHPDRLKNLLNTLQSLNENELIQQQQYLPTTEELEISGFTDAELRSYDKFWDSVSVERTLMDDRYQKGSALSDRMAIVGRLSHHHLFLHKKWEKSNKIA